MPTGKSLCNSFQFYIIGTNIDFTHPHMILIQKFGFSSVHTHCTQIAPPSPTGFVNTTLVPDTSSSETAKMQFHCSQDPPSMLPLNGSNRFWCTIFTLPSLAIGVILKTGNPAYDCPST